MNDDRQGLALRRRSIRTLTTSELSLVHGGRNNDAPTCAGGCNTNTQKTK